MGLTRRSESNKELVFDGKGVGFRGKLEPERTHGRHTRDTGLVEKSVPQGQKRISSVETRSDDVGGPGRKEIRLSAFGIMVGVSSEEGMEGTSLVPSLHEFSIRVSKESTDISSTETDAGHTERQEHRLGSSKMFPLCSVVTGPDGSLSL